MRSRSIVAGVLAVALLFAACGDAAVDVADEPGTSLGVPGGTVGDDQVPASGETAGDVDDETEDGSVGDDDSVNEDSKKTPAELRVAPTQPERVPPVDVETSGVIEPGAMPAAERARADLAEHLGVDADAIEIMTAEFVVWPDGSLGCPRPGMRYIQVMTDGVRIILGYDGVRYAYHGGGTQDVFRCEQPAKPAPGVPPGGGFGDD